MLHRCPSRVIPPSSCQWRGIPWATASRSGRALSASSSESKETRFSDEQPPVLVRAGLVGASTALMTPIFPIIGFNQLVFRFATPKQQGLINGGTSMLYFSAMVLAPNAFYYAPILLPFAVSNGVTAAALYLAAETALGGPRKLAAPKLGPIPLAGPGLGLATAMMVPWTYPYSWTLVYGPAEALTWLSSDMIWNFCYSSWMGPCLAMTGLVSGLILDVVLRPLVLGVPGWHWPKLAGVVLAATSMGLVALYSTSTRTDVPHLADVSLDAEEFHRWFFPATAVCFVRGREEFCWVPGLDHHSGKVVSEKQYLVQDASGSFAFDPGAREVGIGSASRSQALLAKAQDGGARCYSSHHLAFFDGLVGDALGRGELSKLADALPLQEAAVTDALVVLLASSAPVEVVSKSLEELWPLLLSSARFGSRKTPWPTSPEDLLSDLRSTRSAQFRELQRLEAGAPEGPFRAEELRSSLQGAGIIVARAQSALRALGPSAKDDASERASDWLVLGRHLRQERLSDAKQKLIGGVLATLGIVVALKWLSFALEHIPKD
ncbi:unnamed protein product [Polarella glacialis]|uniref:Uncharacterized protein n=1 Tax=Polarella glacialis TaxID=89957 RepID=A0A813HMD1_POLGL|nr:unnamed protein product [Polarella glacialis]